MIVRNDQTIQIQAKASVGNNDKNDRPEASSSSSSSSSSKSSTNTAAAAEESIDCSQLSGSFYYEYCQDATLANGEHKYKNVPPNGLENMDVTHRQGLDTCRIDNHHHREGGEGGGGGGGSEGGGERPISFHMKVCMNEGPAAALMDRCLDYAAINSGSTRYAI